MFISGIHHSTGSFIRQRWLFCLVLFLGLTSNAWAGLGVVPTPAYTTQLQPTQRLEPLPSLPQENLVLVLDDHQLMTPPPPVAPPDGWKKFRKSGPPWRLYPRRIIGLTPQHNYVEIGYPEMAAAALLLFSLAVVIASFASGNPITGGVLALAIISIFTGLGSAVLIRLQCSRPTTLMWAIMYYGVMLAITSLVIAVFGVSSALAISLVAFSIPGVFFLLNWYRIRFPS